jgi:D-tyrosyl-tRNA(Tyr) deacylase
MRLVIQRVREASVTIDGAVTASIGPGLLVLCGVGLGDTPGDAVRLAGKTARLRIFEDEAGKMNRSVLDTGGAVLVVSQFTLYGDCGKGNRPSFVTAAGPEQGEALYTAYVEALRGEGVPVQTGTFRAMMQVALVNDGPVTLLLGAGGADTGGMAG